MMRVRGIAADVGRCRGERHGECGRDRIVAVGEVLIEDLPADPGAGDDVADGQLVDGPFVRERERRLAQPGADPFGAGIGAVGCGLPSSSVGHFVDS